MSTASNRRARRGPASPLATAAARAAAVTPGQRHWHKPGGGAALGYRRASTPANPGCWLVRYRLPGGRYAFPTLAAAVDLARADGATALSFAQALVATAQQAATRRLVVRSKPEQATVLRREWLTEAEVEAIICQAASARDGLMILMCYRHGLRVSELVGLTWSQVDLDSGRLSVRRLKHGADSVHPLSGREILGLRALRRQRPGARYVFGAAGGAPMTRNGFHKLLVKAADRAGIADVHPHLLRHACGFKLVNEGFDTVSLAAYLGHRQVANTKRYLSSPP